MIQDEKAKLSGDEEFVVYLEFCAIEVKSWPNWERSLLGGIRSSDSNGGLVGKSENSSDSHQSLLKTPINLE